jgi:hypothetical protein
MAWTNILGQTRVGVRGAVQAQVQTTSLLLDTYSGAAAAYSLRKLTSTYTGSAIRVRRSSDNAEQNIGFDANGNLNTVSLLAFVGSGNGFVTTWYDQSGNSKNATQTTSTRQPWIVESGVLLTSNGRPGIKFMADSSGSYFLTSTVNRTNTNEAMSMYAVYRLLTITRQAQFGWGVLELEPGAGSSGITLHQNGAFAYSPNNAAYWSTNLALGSVVFTGGLITNSTIYYNGIATTSGFTYGSNGNMQVGGTLNIGKGAYSGAKSVISELIFYPNGSQNSNVSSINNNLNSYYSIYLSDSDAQAFVTAASITDVTQKTAINTLVTDLKTAGIWSKMKALYPFVGGTATSHKCNLKDPRDLDAAFRLVFNGGWTHTSTGAKPNGTTGYANTYFNPTVQSLSTTSQHLSYYSRTNIIENAVELGAISSANVNFLGLYVSSTSGTRAGLASSARYNNSAVVDTRGLFIASRIDTSNIKVHVNGSVQASQSVPSTGNDNFSMYIGAYGALTPDLFSTKETAFASIGDGLTDAEAAAFYTAVQKYQTTLGRAV